MSALVDVQVDVGDGVFAGLDQRVADGVRFAAERDDQTVVVFVGAIVEQVAASAVLERGDDRFDDVLGCPSLKLGTHSISTDMWGKTSSIFTKCLPPARDG